MKTIKLGFVDTFDGTSDFFLDTLKELFEEEYAFERDDQNPHILFFGDENFGNRNLSYDANQVLKIFYTGENRRFYNYQCHYGITFDHIDDDRHFRLPLYILNIHYLKKRHNISVLDEWKHRANSMDTHKDNDREFCGYVQANPNCVKRNEFFQKLNEYKKIDSAGPHFNNTGFVLPRGEDGILKKLEFLRKKKFTLAFENGSYPGYATEKLLEAWLAGTVPIYWGSPTVALDFNPKAFINWHDFSDDNQFLEYIKLVDTSPYRYNQHRNQELIVGYSYTDGWQERFINWFGRILKRHFI